MTVFGQGAGGPDGAALHDLSRLPATGFRSHGLWFWAGLAFMLMEAAGFALAGATYVYLMNNSPQWPPEGGPPDLGWGTAQTVLLVASVVPTWFLIRAARRREKAPTQAWAVLVAALNAVSIVVRGFEFKHLNTHWDLNAYGSATWALILLHTAHLLTDFIDTGFLTVFLFTHPIDDERFSDVDDDAVYWIYVVATWLPLYLLIYWAPRWGP